MSFLCTLIVFSSVQSRLSFKVFPVPDEVTAPKQLKSCDEPVKEASLENMMENIPFPSKDTPTEVKEPVKVAVPQADFMLGIAGMNSCLRFLIFYYIISHNFFGQKCSIFHI